MEDGDISMPRRRKLKKVTTDESEISTSSDSQDPSSAQGVDPQELSSTSSKEPSLDRPEESGSDEKTPQDLRSIVVENPNSSKHFENGTSLEPSTSRQRGNRLPSGGSEGSHLLSKKECNGLYLAILKDDWKSAKNMLEKKRQALEFGIPPLGMTPLQLAIALKRTTVARKLLKIMDSKDFAVPNGNGDTALGLAALSGVVKIATELVDMNNQLPFIRDRSDFLPVHIAALHGNTKMVSYLFSVTPLEELTDRIDLLVLTILCDSYGFLNDPSTLISLMCCLVETDIALKIAREEPKLATAEDRYGRSALRQLAKKPFAIGSRRQMSVWQSILNFCFKGICHRALMQTSAHQLVEVLWENFLKGESQQKDELSSMVFSATELGNVEFLKILIHSDPKLIWMVNGKGQNIFQISILYRQESIFSLIYEIGIFKDTFALSIDSDRNNMLHLAGMSAPPERLNVISGAALQLQWELLWFKEIEKIVPYKFLDQKNSRGKKPIDLFKKKHKDLQREGEEWMKNTATHCMLVATLIATVVFAAAFTVPGGNDQTSGTPIFGENGWFLAFFLSDSIALLSSSASILIFLSILTSRYTQRDFLRSLHKKLLFGLSTLFVSIVAMVIAFSATSFLVYKSRMAVVPIAVIALAGCPISIFVVLHFRLWVDVIRTTFWSRFLFQPSKRRFFKPVGGCQFNK